jgi:membrane-associated phospholipid phosphatase
MEQETKINSFICSLHVLLICRSIYSSFERKVAIADKETDVESGETGPLFINYPGDDPLYSRFTTKTTFCHRLIRASVCRGLSVGTLVSLVVSAIPYMSFLLIYAANCKLLILPTSEGGGYGGCGQSEKAEHRSTSGCSSSTGLFNIGEFEISLLKFSPNRLIASLQCPVFDFLSTVPYLAHYVIPIFYPLALVLVGRVDCARQFYRLVGWTMWMHYALWYLVPTGPPWYYNSLTAKADPSTLSNLAAQVLTVDQQATSNSSSISATSLAVAAAVRQLREGPAFARVDEMTGLHFFRSMFAGNPVPYAAFPSGHVAWPTCIVLTQPSTYNWPFVIYVAAVAWATMYSGHHYFSDVIGAIIVVLVVNRLLNTTSVSAPCMITVGNESCLPTCGRLQRFLSSPLRFFRSSNGTGSGQSSPRQRYAT